MSILCRQCESRLEEGAVVCPTCGRAVDVLAVPARLIDPLPDSGPAYKYELDSDLVGIGGWLILPCIGLAISPFSFLHGIYTDLSILFGSRLQSSLAGHPALAGLILFEAVNNSLLFATTIFLNVLLYRKKKAFSTLMVIYLTANFVLGLADHLFALRFYPQTQLTGVARGFFGAAIWIPYFLQSQRVKETFVN